MITITPPPIWDAKKFAARYGLDFNKDFYVDADGQLVVFPTLPDDPPIFEAPDPFVPLPAGVQVHHWPELLGWQGNSKVIAQEPLVSPAHHECYYIVAPNQIGLDALTAMPQMQINIGQCAYLVNKKGLVFWDGTKWS